MLSSIQQDPRFEHLYQHNDEFRKLTEQHKQLKREVEKMKKAVYLGPDMESRMQTLKKQKLDIKDRLKAMLEDTRR